ncbi:hypothetical protein Purlil1_9100 [Purpureocillium lilacinum]|uniref:60S ribosomal protein L22 n=1 Tax=Purpureocillium lilacinum TaxID=33203 RepID=A0ABR0BR13_PURLI|nr:hypothetical protein Purlil1_9100 [Purpureocillium lilacinum]
MAPQAQKKSGKAQKQTKKVSFLNTEFLFPSRSPSSLSDSHLARGGSGSRGKEQKSEEGSAKADRGFCCAQFIINAQQPASDKIFDVSAFEKFLQDRIKVEGRTNNLGDNVVIQQAGEGKIEVIAHNELSGRYLKYLTKKFLKKQQLRDWLRVVSTSRGVYELKFFNVVNDEADEDDE